MSREAIDVAAEGGAFPYPGGKTALAPWVLDHLAEHETYVEPFGGAGSVLFAKPRSSVEVYNDADRDVVHFFEVLRNRREELVEYLEGVPYSRALYQDWTRQYYDEGVRPDDEIERAGRWFAIRYFNFGGKRGGKQGFAAFAGRNKARSLKNQTARLKQFSDRLREVIIEAGDYAEVLQRYDTDRTLFYLDPPYVDDGGYYPEGAVDLDRLRRTAERLDGKVAISAGAIPDDVEAWHITERPYSYSIDSRAGRKQTTEVLLTTYDPATTPIFAGQEQLRRWSQ